MAAYKARYGLPGHPLTTSGYLSIGCAPCTSIVKAGRMPALGGGVVIKLECGLHNRLNIIASSKALHDCRN